MTTTIARALELYLCQLWADGRSAHTVAQARRHLRQLAGYLPEHHVEEIGHEDLARFLCSPAATRRADRLPKKAASVNALRSSLRAFFGYVHRAGLSQVDASALLKRARAPRPRPRGMSEEECRRLLEVLAAGKGEAARRDRVLFGLMLATGVRIGSALGLDVPDVDFGEGVLRLRSVKGGGELVAYLPAGLVEGMRELVAGRVRGALFRGRDGKRLGARQVHRRLVGWCERAGLGKRVSPHGLRHTFAQRLYERSGDVLLVQAALGHRSIMSTVVYANACPARVKIAVEMLAGQGNGSRRHTLGAAHPDLFMQTTGAHPERGP